MPRPDTFKEIDEGTPPSRGAALLLLRGLGHQLRRARRADHERILVPGEELPELESGEETGLEPLPGQHLVELLVLLGSVAGLRSGTR